MSAAEIEARERVRPFLQNANSALSFLDLNKVAWALIQGVAPEHSDICFIYADIYRSAVIADGPG